MTTILDEFNYFYTALPRFDEYLEMYSGEVRLAYQLRNLFKDYGKLCIEAVRWMTRKPIGRSLAPPPSFPWDVYLRPVF